MELLRRAGPQNGLEPDECRRRTPPNARTTRPVTWAHRKSRQPLRVGASQSKSLNYGLGTLPFFSIDISILSPTSVLVSEAVRHGSSNTDEACIRIGEKRQGCK